MEGNRKVARRWLQKALENLAVKEELLLPAKNKADAKQMLKLFTKELKKLVIIDPTAIEMQITTKFKDRRFWLVLKKVPFSSFIAFKKGENGKVERVLLEESAEEKRRLFLMLEDGYTIEMLTKED